MKISQRACLIPESPIRKLAQLEETAKNKGIKVYHLNIGEPDLLPPPAVFDFLHNYKNTTIGYSHSQGEKEFLKSLVNYYQKLGFKDLKENNFIATLGGSEAILWAMITVANPNEEILTFEPFYTNFQSLAIMAGVKLIPIETKIDNGFHLPDDEEIIKKINAKTKAILICNPNNPTGTVYTQSELIRLWQICQKNDLFLLSDEVYREFVYDDNQAISALTIEQKYSADLTKSKVIILDSFSKRFSLCGARVGLACSRNPKIMEIMLRYGQARLSAVSFNQLMVAKTIIDSENYLNKTLEEFTYRRELLIDSLTKIPGVVFQKPEGAFYVIAKLPVKDSEAFCRWLLTDFNDNKETIMLAPANGFYLSPDSGKEEVRFAYVLKTDDLKRAMQILAKAITVWQKENNL
ncbi:pyridoxal phosphate-dependent aminotransferase [Patescibacteria group bacterium]|nr:pyridoxal phosphate-dependent aminotransferase [Patescibacteria group bacterium]